VNNTYDDSSGFTPPCLTTKLQDKGQMAIKERIQQLTEQLTRDMFLLNGADADTLVFVDPPPKQPEQDDLEYKEYHDRCLKPHRVHSAKFLALNSTYFNKAFGPTKQYRLMRKRGLVNNLPPGIKYVLDLTPPTEGEDAAYLMTELSCSMGVRTWFQAEAQWDVSKTLIGGYDEFEPKRSSDEPTISHISPRRKPVQAAVVKAEPKSEEKKPRRKMNWNGELPKPPATQVESEPSSVNQVQGGAASATGAEEQVSPPRKKSADSELPVDYSVIRHRSAIERVLHAVSGLDPKLDSAPKIWTFFAAAKYFDCARHSCIGDWLIRWMYATPNSYFIELNPETASQVANGVQCLALCRDSYAILVGEEALDNLRRTRNPMLLAGNTNSYGRAKEELTEEDQTRVEYGSKSFLERVHTIFQSLVDEHMLWLNDLPEFRFIRDFKSASPQHMKLRQKLIDTLKEYVRGRLYWAFCRNHNGTLSHLKETSSGKKYPNPSYSNVYNSLDLRERIFTRTAWTLLQHEDFSAGDRNAWTDDCDISRPQRGWSKLAKDALTNFNVREVQKDVLKSAASDFREIQIAIMEEKERAAEISRRVAEEQAAKEQAAHEQYAKEQAARILVQAAEQVVSNSSMKETLGLAENATSVLPDRTRHVGNDVPSLSGFQDLSMQSPPRKQVVANATKPRDKRRKLSEVEALFTGPNESSESEPGHSKSNDHRPQVYGQNFSGGAMPSEEEMEPKGTGDQQKPQQQGQGGRSKTNRNPYSSSAYVDGLNEHGLDVFVDPSIQNQDPFVLKADIEHALGVSHVLAPPLTSARPIIFRNTSHLFTLAFFFRGVHTYIRALCSRMLAPANGDMGLDALTPNLTETLTCLDDSEWKYLPLWAGGCDDGSGGVYIDGVPSIETGGFSAPGPKVHTGSVASSENSFDTMGSETSTGLSRDTSTLVHDGFSDTLDRNRVYDADSLWDEVMATKDAQTTTDSAVGKGKGETVYVDGNDNVQTMIHDLADNDSVKADAMDEDNWDVGDQEGFDSGIEETDPDNTGEEDEYSDDGAYTFEDAHEVPPTQEAFVHGVTPSHTAIIQDVSDEDSDTVMV
jgi:hypothetical protein